MTDDEDIAMLPLKKRVRPVLLGEYLDNKLQLYVKKVREGGGVLTARILIAGTRGITMACDRSRLVQFGEQVQLKSALGILVLRVYEIRKAQSYYC